VQVALMPKTYQYALLWIVSLALLLAWQSEAAGAVFDAHPSRVTGRDVPGDMQGKAPWKRLAVRSTFFREMARGAQARSCEANLPPEPLATPDPVLNSLDHMRLTVSFVVGIDGRVYGPLVLEGLSRGVKIEQTRPVVEAVRTWRFRPAVCNGAPTEAEAKVEFYTPSNRF
jgi:hypothetical protein